MLRTSLAFLIAFTLGVIAACVGAPPTPCTQCGERCVDLQADSANCGTCSHACAAGSVCRSGTCSATCAAGQTSCGSGCVDVKRDPANCGACDTACASGQACDMGQCTATCHAGTNDCSGSCVDLQSDPAHCHDCATACAAGQKCSGGSCVGACRSGQTDCSGACVDLTSDLAHCGGCSGACSPAHVTDPACLNGVCSYTTCATGYADCDGDKSNGCERRVGDDLYNCGACDAVCRPTNGLRPANCTALDAGTLDADAGIIAFTDGGSCSVPPLPACPADAGTLVDGGTCQAAAACGADAGLSDGGCLTPRPTLGAVCKSGSCGVYRCRPGYGDCDGNAANGCESPLLTGLCPSTQRSYVFPNDDVAVSFPRNGNFTLNTLGPSTIYWTTDNSEPTPGAPATMSMAAPVTLNNIGDTNVRWFAVFPDGKREQTRALIFRAPPPALPQDMSWGFIAESLKFRKNGQAAIIAAPGEQLIADFQVQYWRSGANGYCPGCATPMVTAVDSAMAGLTCDTAVSTYPGTSGMRTMTFNAPMTPGFYYARYGFAYQFACTVGADHPFGLVEVRAP